MGRILDYDHATRTKTIHHYDNATGQTWLETVQDVQPYLERNKRLANDTSYADRGKKSGMYHIATIPNNLIVKIKAEHGIDVFNKDDLPKLERLLMSREYQYLRTCHRI